MNEYITATMPWAQVTKAYYGAHDNRGNDSSLHYRGWTLVDTGGAFRYATKDGATKRMRVCRKHVPHKEAVEAFRAVVDEREASA